MNYVEEMINEIKTAKTDKEIFDVLYDMFITTQIDSNIREQFGIYYSQINKEVNNVL